MELSVDIIEVLDSGQYKLNESELISVLKKAENCDNFALISIIGPKLSGKTFLMNCFISYLESNQRNIWPQNHTIKCDDYFHKTPNPNKRVVQMWNKPLILEVDGHRTAIFLMDSSRVFESTAIMSYNKLVEDITGLFFNTSSTVIYLNKWNLWSNELEHLKTISKRSLEQIETIGLFEELFILISDWDPNYNPEFNSYLFGSKNGNHYLKKQFKDHNLDNYFDKIECFLLPSSGKDITTPDFIFNDLNDHFNRVISSLLTKLLNVDEMTLKTDPITKKFMSTKEWFNMFESYVNKLNNGSVSIDFGNNQLKSDAFRTPSEKSNLEPKSAESLTSLLVAKEKELEERHVMTIKCIDGFQETCKQILDVMDSQVNATVFGQKEKTSDLFDSAHHSFGSQDTGTQTYASVLSGSTVNTRSNRTVLNKNEETKRTESPMDCGVESDDVKGDTNSNNYLSNDESMDTETSFENSSNGSQTHRTQLMETDESLSLTKVFNTDPTVMSVSNEVKTASEKHISNPIVNNQELQQKFEKFSQRLCDEYKNAIESKIFSDGFNLKSGFTLLHRNASSIIFNRYKIECEKYKIDKQISEQYREKLSKLINGLMSALKKQSEELYKVLENQYIDCLQKSLTAYDNQLNNFFVKEFKLEFNENDLKQIHRKYEESSLKLFDEKVRHLNRTNSFITKSFKDELNKQLLSKLQYNLNSMKTFQQYLRQWEKLFENQRYFEINFLEEKHTFLKNELKIGFNPLLNKLIDKSFDELCENYKSIKDKEEELFIGPVKDDLIYNFRYNFHKLSKRGFYNRQDIEKKFDRLLNYTLNTFKTVCDLASNQNNFCDRLKSEMLSNKLKTISDYLKNSNEAKTLIERAKRESIGFYSDRMRECFSNKTPIDSNDFYSISSSNLSKALKHNEEVLKSIEFDFDPDFYQSIYNNNVKEIDSKIKSDEQIFSQKLIKIIPTIEPKSSILSIHFGRSLLFAGIYENQFMNILDKTGQKFRPNCIAIGTQILYGNDAKEYLKSIGGDVNQNFDIKNLLLRKKKEISAEELNSYPFQYSNTNSFVRIEANNESINYDFSIESLIALQVLDIKSDAEKQMSTDIARAVFTVPTHYTMLEKNAFRNVAEIVGLESVRILSEITAAAIGYSYNIKPVEEINLLIVSLNDFYCEIAIVRLRDRVIKYDCYYRENLLSHQTGLISYVWRQVKFWDYPNQNNKILNNFKKLLDKLKNKSISKRDIHHILLLGASEVFDSIKGFISENFKNIPIIDCRESDLLVKGSAIFAKYMFENNSEFNFNVTEVAFHSYEYEFKHKYITCRKVRAITLNCCLPHKSETNAYSKPFKNELPIEISIFADQTLVSVSQLRSIDDKYWSQSSFNWKHEIIIELTQFEDLKVNTKLIGNKGKNVIDNQLVEYNLGMTAEDLENDKQCIESLKNKLKKTKILSERNSVIDKIKDDLNGLYLSIKKRFDANKELRGLKKKRIEEQLNKTQELLNKSDVELKTYENQKTLLQEIENMKF